MTMVPCTLSGSRVRPRRIAAMIPVYSAAWIPAVTRTVGPGSPPAKAKKGQRYLAREGSSSNVKRRERRPGPAGTSIGPIARAATADTTPIVRIASSDSDPAPARSPHRRGRPRGLRAGPRDEELGRRRDPPEHVARDRGWVGASRERAEHRRRVRAAARAHLAPVHPVRG